MSTERGPYFDLGAAYREVADADGVKAKLLPGLVLAGKGLFNAGRFATEEVLPRAVRQVTNGKIDFVRERLKDESLSAEERTELERQKKDVAQRLEEYEAMLAKGQAKRKA